MEGDVLALSLLLGGIHPGTRHGGEHVGKLRRGDQQSGKLVTDQGVRTRRLCGARSDDQHRGGADAGGDVPRVIVFYELCAYPTDLEGVHLENGI
jgi:hypothetical protein